MIKETFVKAGSWVKLKKFNHAGSEIKGLICRIIDIKDQQFRVASISNDGNVKFWWDYLFKQSDIERVIEDPKIIENLNKKFTSSWKK